MFLSLYNSLGSSPLSDWRKIQRLMCRVLNRSEKNGGTTWRTRHGYSTTFLEMAKKSTKTVYRHADVYWWCVITVKAPFCRGEKQNITDMGIYCKRTRKIMPNCTILAWGHMHLSPEVTKWSTQFINRLNEICYRCSQIFGAPLCYLWRHVWPPSRMKSLIFRGHTNPYFCCV